MRRLAGVLVLKSRDEVLVIQRARELRFQPGYWSFPGGGAEDGDGDGSPQERATRAAIRECEEEVGVKLSPSQQDHVRLLGRWQTPAYAGPGFDTFFFSLRIDGSRPQIQSNPEVVDWEWMAPERFRQQWRRAEKIAALPVLQALAAAEEDNAPPYTSEDHPRGFLCMGGPALYLPLRTATLPPATHTNCVFLPTDLGFFLVDPAPVDAEERQLLLRCVHAKEVESGPLLGLVLSHLHYDHLGAAGWLAERLRVPVYASEATAEDLKSGAGAGFSAGGASGGQPIHVDRLLEEGDLLGSWRVLETPGHARGHLCFFDPGSRVLVCGDMCAGQGTILIEPSQGNMAQYLSSLERLAQLEPTLAIPAHGQPLADAATALRNLREHRLYREKKVLRALKTLGPVSTPKLTPTAYDDADPKVWPLAALSVESHLLKLNEDGLAHKAGDVWVAVDE